MNALITKYEVYFKILLVPTLVILGVAAPYFYHVIGMEGIKFLPILLVLSLSAYKLPALYLYLIAVAIPVSSHLFTGMPAFSPMPVLQYLVLEGIVFSSIIIVSRKFKAPFIIALLIAIVGARFSSIIMVAFYESFTFNKWTFILKNGMPGMLLNFVMGCVPFVLDRSSLKN